MDSNEAPNGPSRADAQSLASSLKQPEPKSTLEASWPQLQGQGFDQMPLNYSRSQAGASSAHDSHYRYRKRNVPLGQKGDRLETGTESGDTLDESSYSYHSSRDLLAFVKEVDGRFFNNQSDIYVMPSDNGEFERLDKQHYAFVLGQGGLFPCADIVHKLLSTRDGDRRRAILDLGCGSGIWTIEMAREYPQCEVVGLDLAPAPVDEEVLPVNCRFELDDVNLGLAHYHGYFDVIHVRCIGSGLANHDKMMRDVEACLRPGGIVFFIDGDQTIYQEDMVTPIPMGLETNEGGNPDEGSWLHRIAREIRHAAIFNGGDIDGLEDCIDCGIFGHELIDPSTVKVASLSTPLGTWVKVRDQDTQQRLHYIGSLIRQDFMRVNRGWHPMLRKYGIPQETLDRWSERVDAELSSEKFRMCIRWRFTWGQRWADGASRAPAPKVKINSQPPESSLPKPRPRQTSPPSIPYTFQFMEIYHTKEEAAAAMALRRLNVKDLPLTMVVRLRLLTN